MHASDLRREFTNQIIEALEAGGLPPWRKPWLDDPAAAGFPTNALTQRRYSGINPMLLNLTAMRQGFQSRFWATFRQWKELGGFVTRGSRGTRLIFYRLLERATTSDDGEDEIEKIYLMRSFVVFNVEQVEGNLNQFRVGTSHASPTVPDTRFDDADEVVAATEADIRFGGNRAFYRPSEDFIQMPHREQFKTAGQYFETLFHELIHWSEPRRKWEGSYAMNELIAEIGSCYLSTELRIPHGEDMDNHAAYVKSWLDAMKGDPSFIFRASSEASRAADFILAFNSPAQPVVTVAE